MEALSVGHELNKMANANWNAANTGHWRDLIADVREVYSGQLTYSGQWGPTRYAVDNIEFYDDFDAEPGEAEGARPATEAPVPMLAAHA